MKISLQGRKIIGGQAEGEAIVTRQLISFLGGVDPDKGIIVERGHELEGQSITNKVFVFPQGKGSTSGPYVIYKMSKRKTAPSMGKIPMVDRLDQNPLDLIETGDHVKVDGNRGVVEITKKKKSD